MWKMKEVDTYHMSLWSHLVKNKNETSYKLAWQRWPGRGPIFLKTGEVGTFYDLVPNQILFEMNKQ